MDLDSDLDSEFGCLEASFEYRGFTGEQNNVHLDDFRLKSVGSGGKRMVQYQRKLRMESMMRLNIETSWSTPVEN